jgi:hypothetical protein
MDYKTSFIFILYIILSLIFLYYMERGLVYNIINMPKFNTSSLILAHFYVYQ